MGIRTGFTGADGLEVVLREFVCDWPDCPNIAEHAVGVVVELRASMVVCGEHAAFLRQRGTETI